MRIINDTLEQVRDFQRDNLNTVRMENDSSKLTENLDDQSRDESKCEDRVKVVPLYVPDDALVKVFMMHSSHKSALANAPFAAGFRRQVGKPPPSLHKTTGSSHYQSFCDHSRNFASVNSKDL